MLKSIPFLLAFALPLVPVPAHATYSIVACDKQTRSCGVAVQTNNLAVGASVPYAMAGVGAIVSQFETNPNYGPRGLALLSQGEDAGRSARAGFSPKTTTSTEELPPIAKLRSLPSTDGPRFTLAKTHRIPRGPDHVSATVIAFREMAWLALVLSMRCSMHISKPTGRLQRN